VIIKMRSLLGRNLVNKARSSVPLDRRNKALSTLRRFMKIKKRFNAKAMGLFAASYLELYQRFRHDDYLRKANECIQWLDENRSQGYAGACWGLPFDWQSLVLIPQYTPIASVTSICGDAFWNFYRFTGNRKYLDVCQSITEFFLRDLNIDSIDDDNICFSYTTVDRFHIHNGNLFVAEFLIRTGKELHREDLIGYGTKALNYTLAAQNEDGSFYYRSEIDKDLYDIHGSELVKSIDHYHTGFVLRSLYSIYKNTNEPRVLEALSRGYRFYKDNLFEDKAIPKLRPDSTYPVDIHSCAEAILCMSTLNEQFPGANEFAENAFLWTKDNMQDKDGHFYYSLTPKGLDKMPFIRWGQAWMMRALTKLTNALV
jgi:hypothetical protein